MVIGGMIGGSGAGLTPTQEILLNGAIQSTEKGANNGVCPLDNNGLVSSSFLPSYVDDILEFATFSTFPLTGETGKIYLALDTNIIYRWSGSVYVNITSDNTKQDKIFTYAVNTYAELVSIANPNDGDGAFVKETGRFYVYKLSSGNWFNELDGLRAYIDSILAFSPVNQEPIQIDEPIEDYGINLIDIIKVFRDINVFTAIPVIEVDM